MRTEGAELRALRRVERQALLGEESIGSLLPRFVLPSIRAPDPVQTRNETIPPERELERFERQVPNGVRTASSSDEYWASSGGRADRDCRDLPCGCAGTGAAGGEGIGGRQSGRAKGGPQDLGCNVDSRWAPGPAFYGRRIAHRGPADRYSWRSA